MTADFSRESIEVAEAARRLNEQQERALVLDVREQDEWDLCHIQGSLHIPMQQVPLQLDRIPADRTVLVLCHHGMRSLRVARFLRSKGFDKVQNIAGGIDQWALQMDSTLQRY